MENQIETLKTYEEKFEKYFDETPSVVSGDFKDFFELIMVMLPPVGAKMLEIGSGTGRDADYFDEYGVWVKRTDVTKSFIEYQKSKGKSITPLNILTDPIEGKWNVVFANAVLLHFTEKQFSFILTKIARSLVPGGMVAFTVKTGVGEEWSVHKMESPRFFKYWQRESLQHAVEECGFKVTYLELATEGKRLFCIAHLV